MSTSKKARVSSPADEEMKKLSDKYGSVRCDGLANSLKTTRNKTGYRYIYPANGGTYSFFAQVYAIKAGKKVRPNHFHRGISSKTTCLCLVRAFPPRAPAHAGPQISWV